ncbi:hypothetical protein D3C85_1380920 [compost metagenome]
MVNLPAPLQQLFHHREELLLYRAAQAAVGQFVELASGLAVVIAANAAALQDLAVDAQLPEFVDDHRDAAAVGVVEDVAQQGGLAAAEKAGDDGGGDLGGLHAEIQWMSGGGSLEGDQDKEMWGGCPSTAGKATRRARRHSRRAPSAMASTASAIASGPWCERAGDGGAAGSARGTRC